jgi:hypothetical protein
LSLFFKNVPKTPTAQNAFHQISSTHCPVPVFTSSASLVALLYLQLRDNYNSAARAVRGGKTGPRGRERSEGEDETTKHKDLG